MHVSSLYLSLELCRTCVAGRSAGVRQFFAVGESTCEAKVINDDARVVVSAGAVEWRSREGEI